jgi:Zn-finger nucleic acid-binding protein
MVPITYGETRTTIDRCTNCGGLWFDVGEAERLRGEWMSEMLDRGDVLVGRAHDKITDCNCPRCGKLMQHIKDSDKPHIGFEACVEHGMYFDAGEFIDSKYKSLLKKINQLVNQR